jgi:hypothetical protein
MAHFYGSVQGSRGAASRLGGRQAGIRTVAKGWQFGVDVYLYHDEKTGRDFAHVYQTKGSANPSATVQEFVLRAREDGTPETDVHGLLKFAESFLKAFEGAADVNATNHRLVREARRLLNRK